MVVLPGVGKPMQPAAASRRRAGTPGAFALPQEPREEPRAAEDAAPAAPPALSGLLALQEATAAPRDGAARDRAARRHGEAMMQDLSDLQAALLSGQPGAAASRLAARAGAMPQAADPRLAAVLGAIRLRAEVELARAGAAAEALRPESDTENPSATIG